MPPPTRAKRAIEEAPKENPVTMVMTEAMASGPVPMAEENTNNKTPSPNTPRPTTPIPMTEPPAKAIFKPSPRLVLAPCVVRTFALVATRIPMKPARAEQSAPRMKETAVKGELVSGLAKPPKSRSRAMERTKIERTRYSALRKAIAPTEMFSAIRSMRSLPGFCRLTQADFQNVKPSAMSPNNGMQ